MKDSLAHLEKLVALRKSSEAIVLANKLAKRTQKLSEISIILSSYYKLGEYKQGLKKALAMLELSEEKKYIHLWIGNFLNSLGASDHALLLTGNIKASGPEEVYIQAGILLSNFQFRAATSNYELFFQNNLENQLKENPVKILNYTDSLCGLGQNKKAYSIAKKLLKYHTRDIDLFIIHTACMEYLICDFQLSKVGYHLEQAEFYLPPGENKTDYALFLKWKGIYLCMNGKRNQGIPLLKNSIQLFSSFNVREEAWICIYEYLYAYNEINIDEFGKVLHTPGVNLSYKKLINHKFPEVNEFKGILVNKNAPLFIDLTNDEYFQNGKWHIGLKREVLLLAISKYCEDTGISVNKCSCFLWPDEPYSYLKFEDRLFQLIKRVQKQFSIKLSIRDNKVYLHNSNDLGLSTIENTPPQFLINRNQFTTNDFCEWYHVSPAKAAKYIKLWLYKELVSKEGHGPNTAYSLRCNA